MNIVGKVYKTVSNMPRLHVEHYNNQIVLDPLSLTEIDTEQSCRLSNEFILLNDLKECRNLKIFTFSEGVESPRCGYIIKPNHLNLRFCTKLTHLTITLLHQTTFDTIDLTNCSQLTHLSICISYRTINIKNINLTKCINLTHFECNGEIKDDSSMPDLSKCLKLQYVSCRAASGKYFDINLNPILFPDIIECNGKLNSNLLLRLKKLEDSSSRLIESKFNKLEKEIESRIKDEEAFRLLVGRRFLELEKHLTIKDSYYTKEKLKTEDILNKVEKENRLLKIKDDENKKILQQHESVITLILSKFNKLEQENRELRKSIDELRPTKSSFM